MIARIARAPQLLALLLLLAAGVSRAPAQTPEPASRLAPSDTLYEIRLRGGESYVGHVVSVEGDRVTLETVSGVRVELSRDRIASAKPALGRVVNGSFWREDPNRTRLFFSPTGRSLRAGDGYVGVYEVYVPFVSYGITDRVMIAGGSPFYLGLTGEITPPFYVGPKVQLVSRPGFEGSVGALAVFTPGDSQDKTFGIAYGVGTVGDADNAVTGGLGWGYVGTDFSARPVALLAGETRVSRGLKLISENLFVPGETGLIYSAGIRFFGERLSADAGLAGFTGDGETFCCLPLVNFVYHFGKAR
jgi:hypothetical protein